MVIQGYGLQGGRLLPPLVLFGLFTFSNRVHASSLPNGCLQAAADTVLFVISSAVCAASAAGG